MSEVVYANSASLSLKRSAGSSFASKGMALCSPPNALPGAAKNASAQTKTAHAMRLLVRPLMTLSSFAAVRDQCHTGEGATTGRAAKSLADRGRSAGTRCREPGHARATQAALRSVRARSLRADAATRATRH